MIPEPDREAKGEAAAMPWQRPGADTDTDTDTGTGTDMGTGTGTETATDSIAESVPQGEQRAVEFRSGLEPGGGLFLQASQDELRESGIELRFEIEGVRRRQSEMSVDDAALVEGWATGCQVERRGTE